MIEPRHKILKHSQRGIIPTNSYLNEESSRFNHSTISVQEHSINLKQDLMKSSAKIMNPTNETVIPIKVSILR